MASSLKVNFWGNLENVYARRVSAASCGPMIYSYFCVFIFWPIALQNFSCHKHQHFTPPLLCPASPSSLPKWGTSRNDDCKKSNFSLIIIFARCSREPPLAGIDSYPTSQDQFAAERYIHYNSDPVAPHSVSTGVADVALHYHIICSGRHIYQGSLNFKKVPSNWLANHKLSIDTTFDPWLFWFLCVVANCASSICFYCTIVRHIFFLFP
jgi:hypothetical protein